MHEGLQAKRFKDATGWGRRYEIPECPKKTRKTSPDQGPKKSILGPLGRGVLRFSRRAYRILVHIFVIFADFHENVSF